MYLPISEIMDFCAKSIQIFEKITAEIIAEYGMSPYERDVLMYLDDHSCATAAGAARTLRLTKSLVSKAISSLMLRGYISGEQSNDDKRNIYIRVLPAAQPVLRSLNEARRKCCNLTVDGVSEDNIALFNESLRRFNANMDACLIG